MTVPFTYNFCNILLWIPCDFLKFNFSYLSPSSKTIFRSKSTLDSPKSAFRRKSSLVVRQFIRFKQILTVERQTCKPDRYGSSSRPPARISEENLEKYQDLKRELKRIWKSKEALGALWMESTNLRKWLQALDVAKEIEFGYRSYSSLEQLACGHRRIPVSASLNPFRWREATTGNTSVSAG